MKKTLIIALCATMLLAFIACTSDNDVDVNDVNDAFTPEPPTRVELPEWAVNTDVFEIPDDALTNSISGIPVLVDDTEMLIRSLSQREGSIAFRGIVVDEWVEWMHIPDFPRRLLTNTEFLVQEVLLGDLEIGETVTVNQLGGVYMGERVSVLFNDLRVDLPLGEEFIVFGVWDTFTNQYSTSGILTIAPFINDQSFHWIANPYGGRGISALSDESIMTNTDAEIIAHPLNLAREGQEVIITREILAEIAALGGHELGVPIPPEVMEKAQVAIDQRTEDLARWEAEQREVE